MVKIINSGQLPGERVRKVGCERCKSVLEVKDSEWESTGDVREPNVVCIDCPVCNHKIYREL